MQTHRDVIRDENKRATKRGRIVNIDMNLVDVAPDGSCGIVRGLPYTGDIEKAKPGDVVFVVDNGTRRVAISQDQSGNPEPTVINNTYITAQKPSNVTIHDGGNVRRVAAPSSSSSSGNPGEISWDASYIYVCVATDTWKRITLETW